MRYFRGSFFQKTIFVLLLVAGFSFFASVPQKAIADDCCSPTAVINQWACQAVDCEEKSYYCLGEPATGCGASGQADSSLCIRETTYGTEDYGPCVEMCVDATENECKLTGTNADDSTTVQCTDPPTCRYAGTITNCEWIGGVCNESTSGIQVGCWIREGNPLCPGNGSPTPSPLPTGASPTPEPTSPPLCGNGWCDSGEDCDNCPGDYCPAGPCETPTPTGGLTPTPTAACTVGTPCCCGNTLCEAGCGETDLTCPIECTPNVPGIIQGARLGCPAGQDMTVKIEERSLTGWVDKGTYTLSAEGSTYSAAGLLAGREYKLTVTPSSSGYYYPVWYSVCENCVDHPANFWSQVSDPFNYYKFTPVNVITVRIPTNTQSNPPGATEDSSSFPLLDINIACGIGDVSAKTVLAPRSATLTCQDIGSATAYDGTSISLTDAAPGTTPDPDPNPQTQSGGNAVTWSDLIAGTNGVPFPYTVRATSTDPNYSLGLVCHADGGTATGLTENLIYSLTSVKNTLAWVLAFMPPGPWWQVQDGDVYGHDGLSSPVPNGVSPLAFNISGPGGYPGVVLTGASGVGAYDFAVSGTDDGRKRVNDLELHANLSPTGEDQNWLALGEESPFQGVDLYDYFYKRFNRPTSPDFTCCSKPGNGVYYHTGDLTLVGSDWTVGSGDSIVIFVNGKLTIKQKINITEGSDGFVAFITNVPSGAVGIAIDPSIGQAYDAIPVVPDVEGVYVTNGILSTGTGDAGRERFVTKGIFLAKSVALGRDLGSNNLTTSAELFIYNPRLLLSLPTQMRLITATWEEIAPQVTPTP